MGSGGSGLTDFLQASVDAAMCSCSFECGAVRRLWALKEILGSPSGCELLVLMDGWECKDMGRASSLHVRGELQRALSQITEGSDLWSLLLRWHK